MYQNQKANILVLSIVAVLAISLATPTAEATITLTPPDIDWIVITSVQNFVDGTPWTDPWAFEMWVEVVTPGDLDHIDVTGAASFTLSKYGDKEWESGPSSLYSSLAALRDDYPLGTYTLTFEDSFDVFLNSVDLVYSGLPGEPLDIVDFTTYPSTNGQTGISINPTFTWDGVTIGDGDALMLALEDVEDEYFYGEQPVLVTETSWTPAGPLVAGRGYVLEVSVLKVKDWPGSDWPIGSMDYGNDNFGLALMYEHLNEINFTTTPVPGAVFLGAIGVSMVGWLCRHKEQ